MQIWCPVYLGRKASYFFQESLPLVTVYTFLAFLTSYVAAESGAE